MKGLAVLLPLAAALVAQGADFRSEYLREFAPASSQIIALAKAMPAEKFEWRPGPGVRSVGEVYLHIAETNVLLLGFLGVKVEFPGPRFSGRDSGGEIIARNLEFEKTVHGKDKIVPLLERTLDAVTTSIDGADMDRTVDMFGQKATARAVYLRILAHANEHLGQSIAYARMNGVVPPWSK